MEAQRLRWRRFCIYLVFGLIAIVAAVVIGYVWYSAAHDSPNVTSVLTSPWVFVGSLVPALLVLNHGLYLMWQPLKLNPSLGKTSNSNAVSTKDMTEAIQDEYGTTAITIDYYIPTFLIAVAGLTTAGMICVLPICCGKISEEVAEGVKLGALGAYVYVVLTLSDRTFRRDISPGAAIWSGAHLILGPILGAVVALTLVDGTDLSQFTQRILYFFAGLAPRQIVATIQEAAEKFWSNSQPSPPMRVVPLTGLRGVTGSVATRLAEEGVEDVYMLSVANPIRLARNTPFELLQIVAWIDQALLYSTLPDSADALQREGVTGAIDLAYYHIMNDDEPDGARIAQLATAVKVDPGSLADTIRRLYEDSQVQFIWALYQGCRS